MYGMHFVAGHGHEHVAIGPAASPQVMALIVSLLCFLIVAGPLGSRGAASGHGR